jgi:hypothetical protein
MFEVVTSGRTLVKARNFRDKNPFTQRGAGQTVMFDYTTTLNDGVGRRSASSGRIVASLKPALKEIKYLRFGSGSRKQFPKES